VGTKEKKELNSLGLEDGAPPYWFFLYWFSPAVTNYNLIVYFATLL